LISLFNGNFILEKRKNQFLKFLEQLNSSWNLSIKAKPCNCTVSLQHSWLAGFCDADAGFYTNRKTNFKGSKKTNGQYYVKFSTKFYITQHGEEKILLKISNLVGSWNKKLSMITNGTTTTVYNRLEIHGSVETEIFIQYFQKHPLKSSQKIDFLRWVRVHAYKNMHIVVTEKAAQKLATLLMNLEEPFLQKYVDQNGVEKPEQFFSEEEKVIFFELPLNQKHPKYVRKKKCRIFRKLMIESTVFSFV
jgi:hypothetical protein